MSEAESVARRGPKCAQVLEGARKVFMERGYEGASVDEIARAAGTSKATLYSYFPDKRQLFEAVMQTQCGRTGEVMCGADADEPVETTLRRMAASFATFLFSPGAQEMFRVCIAEAGRFPELGAAFHASGPARARAGLVAFFEAAGARGELVIDDRGDRRRPVLRALQGGAFPERAPRRPPGRARPRSPASPTRRSGRSSPATEVPCDLNPSSRESPGKSHVDRRSPGSAPSAASTLNSKPLDVCLWWPACRYQPRASSGSAPRKLGLKSVAAVRRRRN